MSPPLHLERVSDCGVCITTAELCVPCRCSQFCWFMSEVEPMGACSSMPVTPTSPADGLQRISQLEAQLASLHSRRAAGFIPSPSFCAEAAHQRVLKGSTTHSLPAMQHFAVCPTFLTSFCSRLQAPRRRAAASRFLSLRRCAYHRRKRCNKFRQAA